MSGHQGVETTIGLLESYIDTDSWGRVGAQACGIQRGVDFRYRKTRDSGRFELPLLNGERSSERRGREYEERRVWGKRVKTNGSP
jgi:hypothetical protein